MIGRGSINNLDQSLLKSRLELQRKQPISERLEKSPNISEQCRMSGHLYVSYAAQDEPIIQLIKSTFLRAYKYSKEWFGYRYDISLDLWMAPTVVDLQYMTCLPCEDSFFCAPGRRNGMHIILFVSPLTCRKNVVEDRLLGCLTHEICHHFIREISNATVFSMTRKDNLDVPMWLEEGLCQLIQSEVYPSLQHKYAEAISKTTRWQKLDDLYNDLSSCNDINTAYLQAYKETKSLVEKLGKTAIIRQLHLNRMHKVNWNELPHDKEKRIC